MKLVLNSFFIIRFPKVYIKWHVIQDHAGGLQGPRWVQDTVLVRNPKTPEAPGFKLFW